MASQREPIPLAEQVINMRKRMRDHLDKSTSTLLDIKQCVGGLADIEFIAQFLVLAHSHQYPQLTEFSDNIRILELLADNNLISTAEQLQLSNAYCELRDLGHAQVLQNNDTLIAVDTLVNERKNVTTIWQKYLTI